MPELTVIIPHLNSSSSLKQQLPALKEVLQKLEIDFELLIVDDGSESSETALLTPLANQEKQLRIFRSNETQGIEACIMAATDAAQGEHLLFLGSPISPYLEHLEPLLNGLARNDLHFGTTATKKPLRFWNRVIRFPRSVLLGKEISQPECRVWVARKEAFARIRLNRGMYPYLCTEVAAHGFRVGERRLDINETELPPLDTNSDKENSVKSLSLVDRILNLLAAWQHQRKCQLSSFYEISAKENFSEIKLAELDSEQSTSFRKAG